MSVSGLEEVGPSQLTYEVPNQGTLQHQTESQYTKPSQCTKICHNTEMCQAILCWTITEPKYSMMYHAAKGNTSNQSNVQAVRQCPVHRSSPATVWTRVQQRSSEWEHRRVLIWDSRHVVTDRPYPANPALTKTIGGAAAWNTSFNCHQRTSNTATLPSKDLQHHQLLTLQHRT